MSDLFAVSQIMGAHFAKMTTYDPLFDWTVAIGIIEIAPHHQDIVFAQQNKATGTFQRFDLDPQLTSSINNIVLSMRETVTGTTRDNFRYWVVGRADNTAHMDQNETEVFCTDFITRARVPLHYDPIAAVQEINQIVIETSKNNDNAPQVCDVVDARAWNDLAGRLMEHLIESITLPTTGELLVAVVHNTADDHAVGALVFDPSHEDAEHEDVIVFDQALVAPLLSVNSLEPWLTARREHTRFPLIQKNRDLTMLLSCQFDQATINPRVVSINYEDITESVDDRVKRSLGIRPGGYFSKRIKKDSSHE